MFIILTISNSTSELVAVNIDRIAYVTGYSSVYNARAKSAVCFSASENDFICVHESAGEILELINKERELIRRLSE